MAQEAVLLDLQLLKLRTAASKDRHLSTISDVPCPPYCLSSLCPRSTCIAQKALPSPLRVLALLLSRLAARRFRTNRPAHVGLRTTTVAVVAEEVIQESKQSRKSSLRFSFALVLFIWHCTSTWRVSGTRSNSRDRSTTHAKIKAIGASV